jgi:hypothetical protein
MRQAICQYAERAAEKLRQERQYCGQVSVFIKTSPFSKHEPYYSKVSSEQLCIPSRDTRDIIAAAGRALDKIWKEGHNYAKAGVMLNDFRPCGVTQLSLFDEGRSYANSDALMNVLDTINNSGKGKVWFAGRGIAPAWSMREICSLQPTQRGGTRYRSLHSELSQSGKMPSVCWWLIFALVLPFGYNVMTKWRFAMKKLLVCPQLQPDHSASGRLPG